MGAAGTPLVMERSQKRLLGLVAVLPILILLTALVYMVGMDQLEGEPRGFWQAIGWAAETLSTTGYGSDTTWSHPLMVVFVVVLQFIGVFLVFLIFPLYLIPFLEERYGDTRDLVIATNYESYPLMLYLDSHVIVGLSGADLKRDLQQRVDVVIPRKSWFRSSTVKITIGQRNSVVPAATAGQSRPPSPMIKGI